MPIASSSGATVCASKGAENCRRLTRPCPLWRDHVRPAGDPPPRPTSIGTGGRHQSECPADFVGIRRPRSAKPGRATRSGWTPALPSPRRSVLQKNFRSKITRLSRTCSQVSIRICRICRPRTETLQFANGVGSLDEEEAHTAPTDIACGERFARSAGYSVLPQMTPTMNYLINTGVADQFVSPVNSPYIRRFSRQ